MVKKKPIANWQSHEDHVASLYRLLGYQVKSNVNVGGQQADLICEKWMPGAGKAVLYVDAKYTTWSDRNAVSKDDVTQFIFNFRNLKSHYGCTAGVMVSNRPFSQYARAAADGQPDIALKTLGELYEDLLMIRAYLYDCIEKYEAEGHFRDYIPLKASCDRLGSGYEVEDLWGIVENWVSNENNPQLCLLGDFGTGKTTFLQHLHYTVAKKYLAGEGNRIPLFVQLRDYYSAGSVDELLEKYLASELMARVPNGVMQRLTRSGAFLFLLDGFDEMGQAGDGS